MILQIYLKPEELKKLSFFLSLLDDGRSNINHLVVVLFDYA